MYQNVAILAGLALVYSAIAGRVERSTFSSAIVFVGFGLLAGPVGFGIIQADVKAAELKGIAEYTLAILLFADAAQVEMSVLRKTYQLPQRLLTIGLLLTIAAGFGFGVLLAPELALLEVAILATMLAPTDAALGHPVITNEKVPPPIRQGLSFESGLNDGICVPFLLLFLALATGQAGEASTTMLAAELFAHEVGIGIAAGVVVTVVGTYLVRFGHKQGWMTDVWAQVPVIALGVGCFATAQAFDGSGFIAAFAGGLTLNLLAGKVSGPLLHAAEGTGEVFSMLTWVIFGAAVVGQTAEFFTWQILLYAVLSLTVIRMLPVYLSLLGTGLRTDTKLFVGWFGPRGLASVVFLVIAINRGTKGIDTIAAIVVCTVLLSVILHGATANPLVNAYVARRKTRDDEFGAD